jgi:flavin-binding protein dodecin
VERRLELRHHEMTRPTHRDALDGVQPNSSIPVQSDLDASDASIASERSVTPVTPMMRADAALDRLSPERVAEIRMRLETGAYGSFEVMTELAVRMLDSGDLA